jgi:acetyltransferase-like isoleucine patch superfamily enzyme
VTHRARAALLVRACRDDLRGAWRHIALDWCAGSPLAPRPLRFLVYRAFGLRLRTANIGRNCRVVGSRLDIGSGTFVNQRCFFEAVAPITIGADCQLGMEVMILTSHHEIGPAGVSRVPEYRPVTIGDRVWLAARVTVLPGVRIAADVAVAAGSVVTRDLTDPGVYGGVPARRIRDL